MEAESYEEGGYEEGAEGQYEGEAGAYEEGGYEEGAEGEGEGYYGGGHDEGEGEQVDGAAGGEDGGYNHAPEKPDTDCPTDAIDVDFENPPQWYYRGLFDFAPIGARELAFAAGDVLGIVDAVSNAEWWTAENAQGHRGLVPFNYLELAEDAQAASSSSEMALEPDAAEAGGSENSEAKMKAQARRDELVGAMREREALVEAARGERIALEAELAEVRAQTAKQEQAIVLAQNLSGDSFFYDIIKVIVDLELDAELQGQLSLTTQSLLTDLATVRERLPLLRGADAVITDFSKNLEKSLYTSTSSLQVLDQSSASRSTTRDDIKAVLSAIRTQLEARVLPS